MATLKIKMILVSGGSRKWKGDQICDDINNNQICEYDGGDCCGANVKKQYCFNCSCVCKLYTTQRSYES